MALAADALADLIGDVRGWRSSPVRERWLSHLTDLAELPRAFAEEPDAERRLESMNAARAWLEALGSTRTGGQRLLYEANNPIGEDCYRDCRLTIGQEATGLLERSAAPWFDLWRDTFAFVASRVAAEMGALHQTAPRREGRVSLPAFLQHWRTQGVPLPTLAQRAFGEVKAAFQELSTPHSESWSARLHRLLLLTRRTLHRRHVA